jgi:hypothetical protein
MPAVVLAPALAVHKIAVPEALPYKGPFPAIAWPSSAASSTVGIRIPISFLFRKRFFASIGGGGGP